MRVLIAAALFAALPTLTLAQQPANPQAPTDRASFMSAGDVSAALAKGKPDSRSTNVRVFSFGPYNVNVEKRIPSHSHRACLTSSWTSKAI
jgi:hypothetical protein